MGDFGDLLRSQGVDFIAAPTSAFVQFRGASDLLAAPTIAIRAARFLRNRKVAIVHSNDSAMHATWGLPARLAGAKLLWHHRSDPDARGLRYFAPWIANQVFAMLDGKQRKKALLDKSANAVRELVTALKLE